MSTAPPGSPTVGAQEAQRPAAPTSETSGAPSLPRDEALRLSLLGVLCVLIAGAPWIRPLVVSVVDVPAVTAWATIFVSICLQALPFLVLGVLVSGALTAYVSPEVMARFVPGRTALAVPAASMAGMVLPGCECGSVPIAGSLAARGVPPAAALAFMLSAPAVNPVVVIATVVAFPGEPMVAVARSTAAVLVAVTVGLIWSRISGGGTGWMRLPRRAAWSREGRLDTLRRTARHDFLHAGGFLVVGGMTAATLGVVVPDGVLDTIAAEPVLAVLGLAVLAVVLAICSEADAFVAASLSQFSLTSRLVFLVVGPTVDVKLIALQAGTFGRRFTLRFAPLTFVVAVSVAVLVGEVLL